MVRSPVDPRTRIADVAADIPGCIAGILAGRTAESSQYAAYVGGRPDHRCADVRRANRAVLEAARATEAPTAVSREPIFTAIRDARAGAAFSQREVNAVDQLLDTLGIARAYVQKIGLTGFDFAQAAETLKCSVAQIRAVWEVESNGGWFQDVRADILAADGPGGFIDGPDLPKILFEAHVFDRETDGRFRASHPNLSSPKWNRALYVGGQGEWLRLHRAMQLDRRAALRSASVGGAQIMGFNHKLAGFDTVEAFWDAMKTSERAHLDAFASFIKASDLTQTLQQISGQASACRAFARGYNGSGYAANSYDIKIAAAYTKWATHPSHSPAATL